MMRAMLLVLAGTAALGSLSAAARPKAADPALIAKGRDVFERRCAPCHAGGRGDDGAAMLPGTAALQAKYKGELPAALEGRSDLVVDMLRYFVRNGTGAMPMFRKTEISDSEIEAVSAYLAASSRAKVKKPAR